MALSPKTTIKEISSQFSSQLAQEFVDTGFLELIEELLTLTNVAKEAVKRGKRC